MNELLFFLNIIIISLSTVIALKISKETLVAMVAIFCILSNFFVLKQITLFGLNPTASDAFSVGAILGLNLLQEYFGKKLARKTIWTCFFALVFYVIVSQIHIAYMPSIFDTSSKHFSFLLKFMPRIAIASISVTVFVQILDRIFYGFLQKKFESKYFMFRNLASLLIVQFIDTVLFTFSGLYGIISNVWQVIFVSFTVKIVTILISVPIISIFRSKNSENGLI